MYLSRIKINPWSMNTKRAFDNPERMHAAVETAVHSPDQERVLWRVDQLKGATYLLILSRSKPDLAILQHQFGFRSDPGETKTYDILLDRIQAGQTWRFKITCSPTKSSKPTKAGDSSLHKFQRGKVTGQMNDKDILKWFVKQSLKHGFEVDPEFLDLTGKKIQKFQKGPHKPTVTFATVTIEGLLTVTNPEDFKKAMVNGIGREKAYGQGLLTIMR